MEIDVSEVSQFLASSPSPEEVMALRPPEALQAQISYLLEKNRTQGLTPEEEQAWQKYEELESRVRIAKAKAFMQLKQRNP